MLSESSKTLIALRGFICALLGALGRASIVRRCRSCLGYFDCIGVCCNVHTMDHHIRDLSEDDVDDDRWRSIPFSIYGRKAMSRGHEWIFWSTFSSRPAQRRPDRVKYGSHAATGVCGSFMLHRVRVHGFEQGFTTMCCANKTVASRRTEIQREARGCIPRDFEVPSERRGYETVLKQFAHVRTRYIRQMLLLPRTMIAAYHEEPACHGCRVASKRLLS